MNSDIAKKRATVLLADDHEVVIDGLRRVLEPEFEVVGAVSNGRALIAAAHAVQPDVIVADISMPMISGIEAVRQIRTTDRRAKIVFLSMHPDIVYSSEAFVAGGSAYVLKTSATTEVVTAIRVVLRGGTYVTPALDRRALEAQIERERRLRGTIGLPPRQRGVVQMLAEGRSTKEIAELLDISPRTVEFHRYRAMKSLGVHTIAELVKYALTHDLIIPPK
jgi:DNA-binding NarL/FixJ family response regulator